MPKIRNSMSRTTRFRRNPYSNLQERATLPDLVALHENGTLFSNPRAMTESAAEEEVDGTLKVKSRSKFNATAAQTHTHPRPSNLESQTEEDELPNSENEHDTSSHLPENDQLTYPPTPSNPHSNIQHNHSPSSNPSTQTTPNSISPHSLRQRRRGLPDLRVITSPTHLAQLSNKNISNPFTEIPLHESNQRETKLQALQIYPDARNQNRISESQAHRNTWRDQEREHHTRQPRNHSRSNPPRQAGKIRLRKNVPPHPRTRFSFPCESPDTSQGMRNLNLNPHSNANSTPTPNTNRGILSSNRMIRSTLSSNSSPSPPQLLPPPLSNPLTPIQYISAILALRASTRNPDYFPLPPGIQLFGDLLQQEDKNKNKNKSKKKKNNKMEKEKEKEQEISFLALQMEQVEDAIRLEGAPAEAREVYYAQFARRED